MTTTTETPPDAPIGSVQRAAPRVAVLMPVYNTVRYVAEAIETIRAQTFTEWELVAVDDGSTDGSADVVAAVAADDRRIRLLRLPHRGVANVNEGLAATAAPLVARMDSDDWAEPTRLAEQVAYLDKHIQCAAVGTWLVRTDPKGNPAGEQKPPLEHNAIDAALLRGDGSAIVQGTTMFRREALLAVGGWRDTHGWVEDMDLYLRLAEVGELANLPRFLYRYRRHGTSVCSTQFDAMRKRLHAMLCEAYRRRGLSEPPPLTELRPDLGQTWTRAEYYRNWACHAIHRNNGPDARSHALSALMREPWSSRSWKVLYWSLAA